MNRFVALVVSASAVLPCACRHVPSKPSIEVLSMKKVIDRNDPSHEICASLTISKADVVTYFELAKKVDGIAFHDRAIYLPCKYEGLLRMDGHRYHWKIIAAGAGYLYDGHAQNDRRYLCEGRCLEALPNVDGATSETPHGAH